MQISSAAITPASGKLALSVGETHVFPSREILAESLCTASRTQWSSYASQLRTQGSFVPFYLPDILDPAQRDAALQDYAGFLGMQQGQRADAFEVLSQMMSSQSGEAIGFVPADQTASAENLLGQMCVRCHSDATDVQLSRARFDVQSLARLTPEEAQEALRRIALPPRSPQLMPPRRAGHLPDWALARLRDYFSARSAQVAARP
jgi:cytochrome c553